MTTIQEERSPRPPTVSDWLLDGALLRDAPFWSALKTQTGSIALYADLGDDAADVGPWLVPGEAWSMPVDLPLPWRHGVHALSHCESRQVIQAHFEAVRYVWTDDGQRFYLRVADARTLRAAATTLPPHMQRQIRGPVAHWCYWTFEGTPESFAPPQGDGRPGRSQASTLTLTLNQFEALIDAGTADRLAEELAATHEEGIKPTHDAEQFRLVLAALGYAGERHVVSQQMRRAIARAGILSKGAVFGDPAFEKEVERAMASQSSLDREAWRVSLNAEAIPGSDQKVER